MTTMRTKPLPPLFEWDPPDLFDFLTSMRPSWMRQAACRGQGDLMHPSDAFGVNQAKRLCAECPVRQECLKYALDHNIDNGVWGGTSQRQRRKMRAGVA